MSKLYRIKDWDKWFEGAKSRTYSNKTSCQMPTKHGLGYRKLVMRKDGPALFGAWCALVQLLSRHAKPRQGYLTDTGRIPCGYRGSDAGNCGSEAGDYGSEEGGKPYNAEDLAILTGMPEELFSELLEYTQVLGWVEVILPEDTARIPQGYHEDTTGPLHLDSDLDSNLDSDLSPKPPEGADAGSGNADSAGDSLCDRVSDRVSQPEESKPKSKLDPLHRRLVLLFQSSIRKESRDRAEMRAWERVRKDLTEEDVELLEWYYGLPKSEHSDLTWNRKMALTQLLNQLNAQLGYAATLRKERGGKINGSVNGSVNGSLNGSNGSHSAGGFSYRQVECEALEVDDREVERERKEAVRFNNLAEMSREFLDSEQRREWADRHIAELEAALLAHEHGGKWTELTTRERQLLERVEQMREEEENRRRSGFVSRGINGLMAISESRRDSI